ncbi:Os11g0518701 [Oryza sativa Japonica Group]|jgi:hypothetical protein|uniref:Os11g0518701 protein n=1 Tax=Oryza sativa subsp. japonica TaxID=39947 RepID=A0A0P0Y314_ORYSJ|nr:Os11g0518701 [Oryza sativa Japonica Group]
MALTGAHGEGEHLRRPAARRREVEPWGRQGSCPEREVLGRTFGKAPARCGEVERAFGDAADREQRRRSSRYAVEAAEVAARPHGNGIHLSSRHAARRRRRRVLHGSRCCSGPPARAEASGRLVERGLPAAGMEEPPGVEVRGCTEPRAMRGRVRVVACAPNARSCGAG